MSPFNRRGDIITRHGKKKNHDLARIFISKKKLPDPSQNQMAIP
jgi:hypothetical protein